MKYYKFLDGDRSCNGGTYTWSLPVRNEDGTWTPGEWTKPVEGELEPCENGYHLCRPRDLIHWCNRDLYEAEITGDVVEIDEKVVVRSCRLLRKVETWNERTARLFAVWCAREALQLVENPDLRSVTAVDTAERYANGEATSEELTAAWDAALDAARAAASAAAWDAALDAASAAETRHLIEMLGEDE